MIHVCGVVATRRVSGRPPTVGLVWLILVLVSCLAALLCVCVNG